MAARKKTTEDIEITPPNMQRVVLHVRGTAPLVQHKFSKKAREHMLAKQVAGGKAAKTAKEARNLDQDFLEAQHIAVTDGQEWIGVPAAAFRAAMIDACRLVGLEMTRTKMVVFVEHHGLDRDDGTPLVRLIAGPPERHISTVRNETGVADVRIRPMWREWEAHVSIVYDADVLSEQKVINLLARAGQQIGIGEGRPFSKKSVGQGWGTFTVVGKVNDEVDAE